MYFFILFLFLFGIWCKIIYSLLLGSLDVCNNISLMHDILDIFNLYTISNISELYIVELNGCHLFLSAILGPFDRIKLLAQTFYKLGIPSVTVLAMVCVCVCLYIRKIGNASQVKEEKTERERGE